MIYVVKSDSKSLSDKIIEKIIKDQEINNENIYSFDYEDNGFYQAFSEYSTIDLNNETKIIILKNANFLNELKPNKEHEDRFTKTLNLTNEKNFIVLTVDKLNKTGKLAKKLKDKVTILEKNAPKGTSLDYFVDNFFKTRNLQIHEDDITLIIKRVGKDFDLLVKELNKLEILAKDNKISNYVVKKTIIDFEKENLFKLADAVLTLDIEKISYLLNELRIQGEPFYLVSERLAIDFARALRYKIVFEEKTKNFKMKEIEIGNLTGWNGWAIRNYSKWCEIWKDANVMSDFFYNTILWNGFVDMVLANHEEPYGYFEKLLISNLLLIKE